MNQHTKEWITKYVHGADISSHLKFFNQQGLSETQASTLYHFLQELGHKTGNLWRPGGCHSIPTLTEYANIIFAQSLYFPQEHFNTLVSKRHHRAHFLWTLETKIEQKMVIIDPTGVPLNGSYSTIQPYFGLPINSPPIHQRVYSNLENLDEWGTNEYGSNFHP